MTGSVTGLGECCQMEWGEVHRNQIQSGSGVRGVEAALVDAVDRAYRRRDGLRTPVRIVVPSRALREQVAIAFLRRAGGACLGVTAETLYSLALGIVARTGGAPERDPRLFGSLIRQLARSEAALADGLDALVDGYAGVEATVTDLLDAGFGPEHAEAVDEFLCERNQGERVRALVRVAARVARELERGPVGHRSRLFRLATERIEHAPGTALPAQALFVYGFSDATGVQTDLIAALIRLRGASAFLCRPGGPFGERFAARMTQAAGGAIQGVADASPTPRVEVLSSASPDAEARALARRLRERLDGGACAERLGVVARDLTSYRQPLRRHLVRLGVPFSGIGESGAVTPTGRRLHTLQDALVLGEAMPAERWLDLWEAPSGAADRARQRRALHARGAARVADVQAARGFCEHVSRWPAEGSLADHVAAFRKLVEGALGWRADSLGIAELRAAIFDTSLTDFVLSREDFSLWLERALATYGADPIGGAGGGVQVLNALEARGRSFDALFVMGLNRGLFPRVVSEDPILPDALRLPLRALLPELPVKGEGHDEEHFLFASLCSASPSLTLSFARRDGEGRQRAPSPLLSGLPASRSADEVPGAPRPPEEHALLAGLSGDRRALARVLPVALGSERWARGRLAVLGALDPRGARRERFGPYDGFIGEVEESDDPRGGAPFVTALENLARCPWQAFVRRLLRVEPVPDALDALPRALDARLLGIVVHATLERVVATGDFAWPERAALESLALECAEGIAREEGIALPGFARVLGARALPYLEAAGRVDWSGAGARVCVLGSEVEGSVRVWDREVRFRADRIDRVEKGLRFSDYKTGRPVVRGDALQWVAYALAGAQAGEPESEGRYVQLVPDLDDAQRVASVRANDSAAVARFEATLSVLLDAWDRGCFVPRLREAERDREPHACQGCEVKQACLRGDSGARARIASCAVKERTSLGVWWLGTDE